MTDYRIMFKKKPFELGQCRAEAFKKIDQTFDPNKLELYSLAELRLFGEGFNKFANDLRCFFGDLVRPTRHLLRIMTRFQ